MKRKIVVFSENGVLDTMTDNNAFELSADRLQMIQLAHDEPIKFWVAYIAFDALAVRNNEWSEVVTVYLR